MRGDGSVQPPNATLVEIVGGEIRSEHVSRDGGLSTDPRGSDEALTNSSISG